MSGSSRNSSREPALGLGLELVVELLDRAGLQLGDERLDVHARHQRAESSRHAGELAQVGGQRLGGAGVLHLDGHLAAVGPAALVDLADGGRRGRDRVELDEVVLPVRAELAGEDLADGDRGHRRRGVLQLGQLLAVGRGQLVGQRGLEDRHRLAELHRPALELAQGAEELLGGALLDLGEHGLGRGATHPLAESPGGAAGVPQRQRGQPGRACNCLAGKLAHARPRHEVGVMPPWCRTCGHPRASNIHTPGAAATAARGAASGSAPRNRVRDHVEGSRPSRWATTSRTAQARASAARAGSRSGTPSGRGRSVARA